MADVVQFGGTPGRGPGCREFESPRSPFCKGYIKCAIAMNINVTMKIAML